MAKCKKCKGNNAKKLSVIEKEGTSEVDISRVVLFGGRVQSRTDAAKEAGYKPRESSLASTAQFGFGCLTIILVPALILAFIFPGVDIDSVGGTIFMIFLMLVTLLLYAIYNPFNNASNREMEKWDKERDKWERTWMCLDCGHKWTDPQTKSIKTQKTRSSTKSSVTKKQSASPKKSIKAAKDGELLIDSGREIIDYDTDGDDGYHSDELDFIFRYINCVDIINKSHISKGDIGTFFILMGEGYIKFYEIYKEDYPKKDIIGIMQWALDKLDSIYSTASSKATGEKRRQKIQTIIDRI